MDTKTWNELDGERARVEAGSLVASLNSDNAVAALDSLAAGANSVHRFAVKPAFDIAVQHIVEDMYSRPRRFSDEILAHAGALDASVKASVTARHA